MERNLPFIPRSGLFRSTLYHLRSICSKSIDIFAKMYYNNTCIVQTASFYPGGAVGNNTGAMEVIYDETAKTAHSHTHRGGYADVNAAVSAKRRIERYQLRVEGKRGGGGNYYADKAKRRRFSGKPLRDK